MRSVTPQINEYDDDDDFRALWPNGLTDQDECRNSCRSNKAYSILGLIKRNFIHMSSSIFTLLYTSLLRPHLDYASSVWCPYKTDDIEDIEKVQKRATKLVIELKHLPYTKRLKRLNLHTLKYRRLRGDK